MEATIHKKLLRILLYLLIIGVGIVMVYPLVWMFFATFKTNIEIYQSTSLIPQAFSLDGYITGWLGSGQYTYTTFFSNTFELVLPMVLCTLVSSSLVSYGFARFAFKGKAWLFSIMLATLMLPNFSDSHSPIPDVPRLRVAGFLSPILDSCIVRLLSIF
jgi:oligogalacturonide transport system permease protein